MRNRRRGNGGGDQCTACNELADTATFTRGGMAWRIDADPTFVDRLAGPLVARVAGNAQAVLPAIIE